MPTTMIHEKIAYDLAKKYPELDTSDFYLGILAPDTPNLHGFAPKEMRIYVTVIYQYGKTISRGFIKKHLLILRTS